MDANIARYGQYSNWNFVNTWKLSFNDLTMHGEKKEVKLLSEKFIVGCIPGMSYQLKLDLAEGSGSFYVLCTFQHKCKIDALLNLQIGKQPSLESGKTFTNVSIGFMSWQILKELFYDSSNNPVIKPGETMDIVVKGCFSMDSLNIPVIEATSAMRVLYEKVAKDFTLVAGDRGIEIHRWLLEHHSTFFRENDQVIGNSYTVEGFDPDVVDVAVKYYYQFNVMNAFEDDGGVDVLNCVLFANKFGMHEFKAFTEAWFITKINTQSVVHLANRAKEANSSLLLELCITFLLADFEDESIANIEMLHDDIAAEVGRRLLTKNTVSNGPSETPAIIAIFNN